MRDIVNTIGSQFGEELNKLFSENKQGDTIRKIWENDIKENKIAFMKDQAKNTGDTGNRFSTATYRVALAIFSRSPAAYEALKSFDILTLPSVSTLKTFMRANVEDPGPVYERLAEEHKHYNEIKELKRKVGQVTPSNEGALIFDEVKVTSNIYWNAKSNKFIGHALSPEDMSSVHDGYQQLNESDKSEKASYFLQFLWRDISSDVDVIGPYYTSKKGLDNKFIMACLFETIHLFFSFGFNIVLLICDVASANLKLLKLLCEERPAVYSVGEGASRYKVKTSFLNVYSNLPIHVMICPSHQLKNMIAALYSSRQNGTKVFLCENTNFGWQAIVDMFQREKSRSERNEPRRVPHLLYSYVYRDQWVQLNVKASKVMQQDHALAELKEELSLHPNNKSLSLTIQYLEACNKLFEQGLLSHGTIKSGQTQILDKMKDGFYFFMGWCDEVIGNRIDISSNTQKSFLAWQTWDLMRVTFYGFIDFVEAFIARHQQDGQYIIPVRLNGSAVETLFSQLKYSAGGHLSSTNYATARSSILIKKQVKGHNVKDSEYRNVNLNLLQQSLHRK